MKDHDPGVPGWLQAIIWLIVVTGVPGATAGAGHGDVPAHQPAIGACVEVRA